MGIWEDFVECCRNGNHIEVTRILASAPYKAFPHTHKGMCLASKMGHIDVLEAIFEARGSPFDVKEQDARDAANVVPEQQRVHR